MKDPRSPSGPSNRLICDNRSSENDEGICRFEMRTAEKKKQAAKMVVLAVLLGAPLTTQATLINIDLAAGQESSARIRDTSPFDGLGNSAQTEQNNQVGTITFGGDGASVHTGFAFLMTGTDSGGDITAANFSVNLTQNSGSPTWNVDRYANRVHADGAFLASDYEDGTLIMSDFVVKTDSPGSYSLDAGGQTALHTYMQNNWAENSYVFLSLKNAPIQTAPSTTESKIYTFGGNSNSTAQLQLTVVPEPSILTLYGAGAAMLIAARFRKTRG